MIHTRKLMGEALEAQNISEVRSLILQTLRNDAGHAAGLQLVAEAMSRTPNLFVNDNGYFPFLKRDCWTAEYADRLEKACAKNFSREKLKQFVDVMSNLKRHKSEHRNRAEEQARNSHAEELFAVADAFIDS